MIRPLLPLSLGTKTYNQPPDAAHLTHSSGWAAGGARNILFGRRDDDDGFDAITHECCHTTPASGLLGHRPVRFGAAALPIVHALADYMVLTETTSERCLVLHTDVARYSPTWHCLCGDSGCMRTPRSLTGKGAFTF